MNIFHETIVFSNWFEHLNEHKTKVRILARIRSAMAGNFGDCKPVGDGISEIRIHSGPGHRLYYAREGRQVYLLLVGGEKSTQKRDILQAQMLWKKIQEG